MKSNYRNSTLTLISICVLIFFVALALGSGETTEPQKIEGEPPEQDAGITEEETEVVVEHFFVGDSVKMGELEFTVNSARWDTGDEFIKPEPGERWLVLDCTIANTGGESEAISSLLMFALYDEDHFARDIAIFVNTKGSLDGELGAHRTMRGEIAFSVEEGQKEWEFIFQPNILGFGQAIYLIKEADVR